MSERRDIDDAKAGAFLSDLQALCAKHGVEYLDTGCGCCGSGFLAFGAGDPQDMLLTFEAGKAKIYVRERGFDKGDIFAS